MATRTRRRPATPGRAVATIAEPEDALALTAAASSIGLDGTSWRSYKLGDQRWQEEAWRHYDICGELRFASNWIANSVSRCRLYIADVDENGRAGEETKDKDVLALTETMFGGPAMKAEAQRLLGIGLYVPGETFIVAEDVSSASKDIWYVCSTSEVHRDGTDGVVVDRSNVYGGGRLKLRKGKDLLIRAWTPHPRRYDAADSSVRSVLPILREIEQLTKKVFAEIDSRLAGAGLLLVPQEIDFPKGPKDPPGVSGLAAKLTRAVQQSLQDQSAAAALVPVMATAPGEMLDKIKHLTFATPLQAETISKLDNAIRRLALGLDQPPEVLLGQGDSNHWAAWQIEESTIKIHVEPLLVRMCDALTNGWMKAAVKILGKDPERYVVWYDTSPLVVRPNREADARELNTLGIVSDEQVRKEGNWGEDAAPSDEERIRKFTEKLVLVSPALISNKDVQEALGIDWDVQDPNAAPPPGPDQGPPGADQGQGQDQGQGDGGSPFRGLPAMPNDTQTPAQEAALLVGADMIVRRALERAGARLLTRSRRGQFAHMAAGELHTAIAVPVEDVSRLIGDAFTGVPDLAARVGMEVPVVEDMLAVYTTALLTRGESHDYGRFATYLDQSLDLIGHTRCAEFCRNPLHPGPCAHFHPGVPTRDDPSRREPVAGPGRKRKAITPAAMNHGPLPTGEPGADGRSAPVQGSDMITDDTPGMRAMSDRVLARAGQWRAERDKYQATRHAAAAAGEGPPENEPPTRGYTWGAAIAEEQGFDGLPQVGSDADLDRAVAAGGVDLWRGARHGRTQFGEPYDAADMFEQARTGAPYWGLGFYGNGFYGSDDRQVAIDYAHASQAGPGAIARMVLRPGARVISYREAQQRQTAWRNGIMDQTDGMEREQANKLRGDAATFDDLGAWAAAAGFDALYADEGAEIGSDQSRHWNILNRTALMISEDTYDIDFGGQPFGGPR